MMGGEDQKGHILPIFPEKLKVCTGMLIYMRSLMVTSNIKIFQYLAHLGHPKDQTGMGKKGQKLPPGDPSAIGKQIGILRHVNSDVKFDGNTQF